MTTSPGTEFARLTRLPPYVFNITTELKMAARRRGEDIIDFGMGNPDGPTPKHIVDKLIETVARPDTHGYSVSRGIPRLRRAICHWYQRRYGVEFDPETEAISTIGSKEGIAHLALATLGRGDTVLVPNPSYPIHIYGPVIAGGDIPPRADYAERRLLRRARERDPHAVPEAEDADHQLSRRTRRRSASSCRSSRRSSRSRRSTASGSSTISRTPTSRSTVGRRRRSCRSKARATSPSSSSRCRRATTWRAGASASWSATRTSVAALARIKGYHDYGTFTPIQVAAIAALEGPQDCVAEIAMKYQKRRDVLVKGLHEAGWMVDVPKASMYVWAKIPEPFRAGGSLEFTKALLAKAKVSVSPGIGFGDFGDEYVRFAMIENENRTRQAVRGIKQMFRDAGVGR
jgi:alanine-synthesizing transaminase